MFLLLGTFLLGLGLIIVFNIIVFKKLPPVFGYAIIFLTAGFLFFTKTVHGIWLGLTILILGVLWLKFIESKKVREEN